jgi:AcrR family transcriptional regulator
MAKIVNKAAKKKEILEASIRVLGRKGAADTKIQDIAEEACIAKGTIYLYFKNKEEIFENILQHHIQDKNQDLLQVLKAPGEPKTKLKTLLLDLVKSSHHQSYSPGFYFEILAALLRSPSQKKFTQNITQSQMAIASLLIQMKLEGVDKTKAFELATGIISLLHGAIVLSTIEPDKISKENIINTMLDQLLK